MLRSCAIAIFLLSAFVASGQEPTTALGTGSISGTIVKDPGTEPLKKVLVQVIAEDQKNGGNYSVTTDADGHFHIENVIPGRYRMFFERTGFVPVNGRGLRADVNVFTIQAGQSTADLFFRMLPTAVLSGRIVDQDGDPMSEVRVVVQRKKPGQSTRQNVSSTSTNDLGEYRLPGLFPGEYWIVVIPPPDFRDYEPQERSSGIDKTLQSVSGTRYVTTYYPGTRDPIQASSVTLKPGDEMPVNLTLTPAHTYRVHGIVTGVTMNQKTAVELVSKGGDTIRSTEVEGKGQFELLGVGPGSYMLGASVGSDAQTVTAQQDVNVVAADVEGIKLVLRSSFTISGHLQVEGKVSDITRYSANLRRAELPEDSGFMSSDSFGTNGSVDRVGNFQWKNVNPGNYIVQIYGGESQGSFLKSVTVGGRDVVTGFTASGPMAIDLLVSTKGGTVGGTVFDKEKDIDEAHPVASGTVVLVPEEKYRRLPDHFLNGSTDQQGHFIIRGIAPGNYTLFAWQDVADGVWHDENFLKAQETNGLAVKVGEGSDQKIELKASSTGEEWR